jgi:hypothetical protein
VEQYDQVRRDIREMIISSGKVLLDESNHIIYRYMDSEYLVMVAVARVSTDIKLGDLDE